MSEAADPAESNWVPVAEDISTTTSGPALKQPTFNWEVQEKCNELLNFEMQIKDIFMTKSYDISDSERVPVVMNWLEYEGLYFLNINWRKAWSMQE